MDKSHSFAKYVAHRFVEVFYNSLVTDIDHVIELFVNDSVLTLCNPNSEEKILQGIDALKNEIQSLQDKTSQYDVHVKTVDAQNIDKNKIIVNVVVQFKNHEESELYVHLFGLEGLVHEKNASYRITNFIIRHINVPQYINNQTTSAPIQTKPSEEIQNKNTEKKEETSTENKEHTQSNITQEKTEPPKEQSQKKFKNKKHNEPKSWANIVSPNVDNIENEEKKDADSDEKPKRQFKDHHKKNEHWKGGQRPRGGSYRNRGGQRNKKINQKNQNNNTATGGTQKASN